MIKAGCYLHSTKVMEASIEVLCAAYTHDIGKPDVKSFENSKGEITEEAHYYSHHNVGAYKSLFFGYSDKINKAYISLLIEYHMRPFMEWKQNEKTKEKDRKIFGDQFINDIMLMHIADCCAK